MFGRFRSSASSTVAAMFNVTSLHCENSYTLLLVDLNQKRSHEWAVGSFIKDLAAELRAAILTFILGS
jgi:hypothetical protein